MTTIRVGRSITFAVRSVGICSQCSLRWFSSLLGFKKIKDRRRKRDGRPLVRRRSAPGGRKGWFPRSAVLDMWISFLHYSASFIYTCLCVCVCVCVCVWCVSMCVVCVCVCVCGVYVCGVVGMICVWYMCVVFECVCVVCECVHVYMWYGVWVCVYAMCMVYEYVYMRCVSVCVVWVCVYGCGVVGIVCNICV